MVFSIGNPLHPMPSILTDILKIFYCYVNFSEFWFESLTVNSDHGGLKGLLIRTQKHVIKKTFQSNH